MSAEDCFNKTIKVLKTHNNTQKELEEIQAEINDSISKGLFCAAVEELSSEARTILLDKGFNIETCFIDNGIIQLGIYYRIKWNK